MGGWVEEEEEEEDQRGSPVFGWEWCGGLGVVGGWVDWVGDGPPYA